MPDSLGRLSCFRYSRLVFMIGRSLVRDHGISTSVGVDWSHYPWGPDKASKEAADAMSVETGGRTEAGVPWTGTPLSSARGLFGRRRALAQGIAEVRGPDASMRRDALFSRMLAIADVVAVAGAFLLTLALSRRSLQLTWVTLSEVPILLIVREARRASMTATRRCCERPPWTRRRSSFSWRPSARWWPGLRAG